MGWQEKIIPELVHCFIVLLFVVHGCRGIKIWAILLFCILMYFIAAVAYGFYCRSL